jgi:hypothetical protein
MTKLDETDPAKQPMPLGYTIAISKIYGWVTFAYTTEYGIQGPYTQFNSFGTIIQGHHDKGH